MWIVNHFGHIDAGNAFQISHADKSFHVFALSRSDKANWLANLHKHINKVAQSGELDCHTMSTTETFYQF